MTEETEPPDLLRAAMGLVGRIKIIHKLPDYRAVWITAEEHLGPYKGLKYEEQLAALEEAIIAEHKKIFPEEF